MNIRAWVGGGGGEGAFFFSDPFLLYTKSPDWHYNQSRADLVQYTARLMQNTHFPEENHQLKVTTSNDKTMLSTTLPLKCRQYNFDLNHFFFFNFNFFLSFFLPQNNLRNISTDNKPRVLFVVPISCHISWGFISRNP